MESEFDLDRIGGLTALSDLIDAVVSAGEAALTRFRQGISVERKSDASPVTEADRDVEQRLQSFIRQRFPRAGFLGEETGEQTGRDPFRFVVDPIDGTRAFVRGLPTWSVLVGLEADDEPVVGVAFMPADGDLFVGVRGGGAFLNGRPLHVSSVDRLADATVSHGGLNQFTDVGLGGLLLRLGTDSYSQRGFADFDGYRQLLLGRVDAMVDPGVRPWDMCAASVLVREAGGRATSLQGDPTIHAGSCLATNDKIHDELLSLIAAASDE